MTGGSTDPELERRFVEWYVWASQHISLDPRRCRAAAWAAATTPGTQAEVVAVAQRAAHGPQLDELAERPPADLRDRAEKAAQAARPRRPSWIATCGIILGIIGILLLVVGGVCFAIISISSTPR